MNNALFLAWNDVLHQLRDRGTIAWAFLVPPIFFYFIGTVTSGFSTGMSGDIKTPIVIAAENPGFLRDQLDLRLRDNDYDPEWRESLVPDAEGKLPRRTLVFDAGLTEKVIGDETVAARYETTASALTRNFEELRLHRAVYTALADVVAADAMSAEALRLDDIIALNAAPRVWQLDVSPAGQRLEIPTGFEQSIPGILVMFTLLVLLSSGAPALVVEREQGLLRRLASAPISRAEVVAGKWGGRMLLAVLQVGVALIVGTYLFSMKWGPDLPMILLVLAAWAAFCASAGLLLGSLARTEGQAGGLGVLFANLLAALGGCWWPIEVAPEWMQALQKLLPTGWTMDALHKLISFEAGAVSVVPHVAALAVGTLVVGALAVRAFRYQ